MRLLTLACCLVACAAPGPTPAPSPDLADPAHGPVVVVDAAAPPDQAMPFAPILFVHGIKGSAADFDAMIARFVAAGWPAERLFARTFADPAWGCNVDNASAIAGWVAEIRATTGATAIDLVAHSMGTLSTRYYMKHLDGAAAVRAYVTLGGMHHGLQSACSPDFPFKPCVWNELCADGAFIADLNAAPATPGPARWVSIYGTGDTTVPNDSSLLTGADNVAVAGATHVGLVAEQPGYDALRSRL